MKRILIAVFVVAAVLVVAYYFLFLRGGNNNGVITSLLPDYFPKEVIKDSYLINLEVLSDTFRLPNEAHRAQISYISQHSMKENIKSFTKYFTDNGFETQTRDAKGQKFLLGRKDKSNISITLWEGSQVKIAIIYILNK